MTNGSEEPVIRVEHFAKRYGRRRAVEDVSLDVPPGRIYGLLGPDGAGKSSLMKALAGVLTFDAGNVHVLGVDVDSERSAEKIKGRIGFMPQGLGLNLYPDLSVEENIDFFARLRLVPGDQLKRRKQRLLDFTRLARFRRQPMKQLSGGMKQKLGLACTLIHQPKLLILDEPTTGVDPVSRRDFWAILADLLAEQHTTVIVSTAYMDEASRFQRMALLYAGRVLAEGDPDQLHRQVTGRVVELDARRPAEVLDRLRPRYEQLEVYGSRLRLFLNDVDHDSARARIGELLKGLSDVELHVSEPELEDVFVALIRRDQMGDAGGDPAPRNSSPPEENRGNAHDKRARASSPSTDSIAPREFGSSGARSSSGAASAGHRIYW